MKPISKKLARKLKYEMADLFQKVQLLVEEPSFDDTIREDHLPGSARPDTPTTHDVSDKPNPSTDEDALAPGLSSLLGKLISGELGNNLTIAGPYGESLNTEFLDKLIDEAVAKAALSESHNQFMGIQRLAHQILDSRTESHEQSAHSIVSKLETHVKDLKSQLTQQWQRDFLDAAVLIAKSDEFISAKDAVAAVRSRGTGRRSQ